MKGGPLVSNNVDEPGGYYVNLKNPDIERQIPQDLICGILKQVISKSRKYSGGYMERG
jgi:hypothetical protein